MACRDRKGMEVRIGERLTRALQDREAMETRLAGRIERMEKRLLAALQRMRMTLEGVDASSPPPASVESEPESGP